MSAEVPSDITDKGQQQKWCVGVTNDYQPALTTPIPIARDVLPGQKVFVGCS